MHGNSLLNTDKTGWVQIQLMGIHTLKTPHLVSPNTVKEKWLCKLTQRQLHRHHNSYCKVVAHFKKKNDRRQLCSCNALWRTGKISCTSLLLHDIHFKCSLIFSNSKWFVSIFCVLNRHRVCWSSLGDFPLFDNAILRSHHFLYRLMPSWSKYPFQPQEEEKRIQLENVASAFWSASSLLQAIRSVLPIA